MKTLQVGQKMANFLATVQEETGAFMFAKGVKFAAPKYPNIDYSFELVDDKGNFKEDIESLSPQHLSFAGGALVDIFTTIDGMNQLEYPKTDIVTRNFTMEDYSIPAEFFRFIRPWKVVAHADLLDDDKAVDLIDEYVEFNDATFGVELPPQKLKAAFDQVLKAINPKCQSVYGLKQVSREAMTLTMDMINTWPTVIGATGVYKSHEYTDNYNPWRLRFAQYQGRHYTVDENYCLDEKLSSWARDLKKLSTRRSDGGTMDPSN